MERLAVVAMPGAAPTGWSPAFQPPGVPLTTHAFHPGLAVGPELVFGAFGPLSQGLLSPGIHPGWVRPFGRSNVATSKGNCVRCGKAVLSNEER